MFFLFVFFFNSKDVVLWMNVFQKMYNNASKARLECLGAGHASSSKICLLSEVRFWDVCGLYGPDGLRLLVLFQNLHCIRRFQVSYPSRWNVQDCQFSVLIALLIQRQWEPRILQFVAVFFFFEEKIYFLFVFERKSISFSTKQFWDRDPCCFASIHPNPLKRERLWGSEYKILVLDL